MNHDFARQRAARAQRDGRPSNSPWVWLLCGVFIGVFGSFLFYLTTVRPQPTPLAGAQPAPAAAPAKPAAPPQKPKFDFYDVLTENEVNSGTRSQPAADTRKPPPAETKAAAAPTGGSATANAATPGPAPAVSTPEPGTAPARAQLQAGSFQQKAEADRRRGEIILLGYAARVEAAGSGNTRTYRVVVGPFETPAQLQEARGSLGDVGIQSMESTVR